MGVKSSGNLVKLFLLGINGPTLARELRKSKATIYKALRLIGHLMHQDVPEDVFSGIIDGLYQRLSGGNWSVYQTDSHWVFYNKKLEKTSS